MTANQGDAIDTLHPGIENMVEPAVATVSDPTVDQSAAIISGSPMFDRDWYGSRYLADTPQLDPALHFLTYGASGLLDPGPHFSSSWYVLAHDDVDMMGVNPLLHYELYGRAEARPIRAADDVDRTSLLEHVRLVRSSGAFASQWYIDGHPDVDYRNPILHYILLGCDAGHDPSPDFSTRDYLVANPDVAATGMNPLVHYLLYGQDEDRPVRPPEHPIADGTADTDPASIESEDETSNDGESVAILRFGATEIALAEPVDVNRLGAFAALAVAQRGLTPVEVGFTAADGIPYTVSDADVVHADVGARLESWLRIDDTWYGDLTTLRLRLSSTGSGVLSGWQRDGAALAGIGSCEVSPGAVVVNLSLLDPLAAIVLGVMTPDGDLVSASMIAFPSTFRGGLHAPERLADGHLPVRATDPDGRGENVVGKVVVESNTAVTVAMARWIADRFGALVTEGPDGPAIATPEHPNGGTYALHVPGDGIPTIAVLSTSIDRDDEAAQGTRWLSVKPDGRATIIGVPISAEPSFALPVLRHLENGSRGVLRAPLILRPSATADRAQTALQPPPGAIRSTIVIDFNAGGDAVPLLAALIAGQVLDDSDLVLLGCADDGFVQHAMSAVPDVRTLDCTRGSALVQLAVEGASVVIAIDASARMGSSQLLATLASTVAQDGVATAGCTIVGTQAEGGAYVVTRVSVGCPPMLILREVALGRHVRGATVPVVAVSDLLCAYSGSALRALGPNAFEGAHPCLSFALHAVDAGYRNLFCDGVAAAIDRPLERWDIVDPLRRPLPVERWGPILAATVQMQAL